MTRGHLVCVLAHPPSLCQQECPCVERVQDSALLPVNVERKVTLVGKHLNVFQVKSGGRGGDCGDSAGLVQWTS